LDALVCLNNPVVQIQLKETEEEKRNKDRKKKFKGKKVRFEDSL